MLACPPDEGPLALALAKALDQVVELGLRPAMLARAPETFVLAYGLEPLSAGCSPLDAAFATEARVKQVIGEVFGDGQAGEALRLLLGACSESRSLPLKTRHRLAAEEMEVKVATFERNYEHGLLEDLLTELIRSHYAVKSAGST